jgi:hypothetical protein
MNFHDNNGQAKSQQWCVMHTTPILFNVNEDGIAQYSLSTEYARRFSITVR